MAARLSNLDLVKKVDDFPYEEDKDAFSAAMSNFWTLISADGTKLGLIQQATLDKLVETAIALGIHHEIYGEDREILIFDQDTEAQRSAAVAEVTKYWRDNKMFRVLSGWRDELYPVYAPDNRTLLYSVERTAAALFGIASYGCHMTAYIKDDSATHGIKFWIPRRSRTKMTWAGMLDNTVAGGMATGELPLDCIIREAQEEASIPEDVVRSRIKAAETETVTYIYFRNEESTGELGLLEPEVEYVFDLELPPDVIPKPCDTEVEQFYLLTVEEVKEAMANGEFKPNCAVVLLDFFMRHGILTEENEPDYAEIKRRMHRPLPFPGPHRAKERKPSESRRV